VWYPGCIYLMALARPANNMENISEESQIPLAQTLARIINP